MAKKAGDVGTSQVSQPVSGPSVSKGFGARGGGYTSFADRFDGGGPGRSGGPFRGGGLLSAAGNAFTANRGMGVGPDAGVGFAGYGYNDKRGNWVPAGVDMMQGGGPGMAGGRFMGGGQYSGLLNMFGVRPMGYEAGESMPVAVKNPTLSQVLSESAATPMQVAGAQSPPMPTTQPVNSDSDAYAQLSQLFAARLGSNPQIGAMIEGLLRRTMTADQLNSVLGGNSGFA